MKVAKFILILLLLFIIHNYVNKENYSNRYQDTDLANKFMYIGTNLQTDKLLLTLYFDRREPNCKYFYNYFDTNYGGTDTNNPIRFVPYDKSIKQPWNQLKEFYKKSNNIKINNKDTSLNTLMIMEEIEVDEYNIHDFNSKKAFSVNPIDGKLKIDGKNQIYHPPDFLDRIPLVTITFLKEKDGKDKSVYRAHGISPANNHYDYDLHVSKYKGIYSPNNEQYKLVTDEIKKFIKVNYEEFIKTNPPSVQTIEFT